MACLKKESTITKRVNDVVMINKAGANVRMVSKKTTWSVDETCCGELAVSIEILMLGMDVWA